MSTLIATLSAEALKLKRTLALWLALAIPLAATAIVVGTFFDRGAVSKPLGDEAWTRLGQQCLVLWGLLMLPLFVALETALMGNMEHVSNHWKYVNTLPVPRGVIYAAKQLASMGLIGLSALAVIPYTVVGGLLLRWLRPGFGWEGAIPWREIALHAGLTYLGAWLLISLHLWLSLRWRNFVVSCAVGIACTIAGAFIVRADWGNFWPWALSGVIANQFAKGEVLVAELLWGCLGGVALAFLGGWDVARQDVL